MSEKESSSLERLQKEFARFLPRCAVPFEWEAYPILDPDDPGVEEPRQCGIGIVVRAEGFRLFDPLCGRWEPYAVEALLFTIRDQQVLNVILSGEEPESMEERPLLRFGSIGEVPGHIALHVEGAVPVDGDGEECDPIDEILLPLPQYPDDEAECLHDCPYVAVRHLTDAIADHCREDCPWAIAFEMEELDGLEAQARETVFNPDSSEEAIGGAESLLADLRTISALRHSLRECADQISAEWGDGAFVRDLNPENCYELNIPLFPAAQGQEKLSFPFLVRFGQPMFLPYCAQDISPDLSNWLFHRVLLETGLPTDLWPSNESREELAIRLPATVGLPSFGEQVASVFEIRVLQLAIERGVGNLLTGEVDESVRAAQPRIGLMRALACQLQELTANRTDFEYTSEISA